MTWWQRTAQALRDAFRRRPKYRLVLWANDNEWGIDAMAIVVKDDEQVQGAVGLETGKGNPAPADFVAPPQWALDPDDAGTLQVAADGKSALFVSGTRLGTALVSVIGRPAATPTGPDLTGTGEIEVVAGPPRRLVLTFGQPVPQP